MTGEGLLGRRGSFEKEGVSGREGFNRRLPGRRTYGEWHGTGIEGGGDDCLSCFAADNHGRWTVNHDDTMSKLPHRTDIYGTIY